MKKRKNKIKWWNRFTETSRHTDYVKYKKALNRANKAVRKAKRKLENKLARNIKCDPKAFYNYARGKTTAKDRFGPLSDENGNSVSDDNKTAAMLNEYFSSVFTQELLDNIPDPVQLFQGGAEDMLSEVDLSYDAVLQRLIKLKPDKAPGVDSIYPVVLREIGNSIAFPLSVLFKRSLETAEVPKDWGRANVTPIYKKGPKHKTENYRPVTKYVDEGHPVDVIYLDFSKAFDKVTQKRLIKKMNGHGIGEKVSSWVESWLNGREQRVVINGCASETV
eukprot:gene1259-1388_t